MQREFRERAKANQLLDIAKTALVRGVPIQGGRPPILIAGVPKLVPKRVVPSLGVTVKTMENRLFLKVF